jgi:phage shock protein PspC (stress-responsive transcriptional regulator)
MKPIWFWVPVLFVLVGGIARVHGEPPKLIFLYLILTVVVCAFGGMVYLMAHQRTSRAGEE